MKQDIFINIVKLTNFCLQRALIPRTIMETLESVTLRHDICSLYAIFLKS